MIYMTVKQYMRTHIVTIPETTTFREALAMMVQAKTNGIVVTNAENEVVGVIDSFHMMNALMPQYLISNPSLATFVNDESFAMTVKEAADAPISEMITSVEGCVIDEDAPLVRAAAMASKKHVRYVPVINKQREVVGLLSRSEIKHAMADILGVEY